MNLLDAVTFRDGIGMDDLTWLAGLISAIAVIVGAVWAMLRPVRAQLHRWEAFWEDWSGTPAGPGRSAVPGVMERLQSIDGELQHNGGNSLKDKVLENSSKIDGLSRQNEAEHASLANQIDAVSEEVAHYHSRKESDDV